MNLSELSDLLKRSTDVLRVETLGSYLSDSDSDWLAAYLRGEPKPDVETKRAWLDRLAAAAERGHPWRRLRIIPRPVPDYVRYACEWSYVDNVAVGEDIRVMDQADWPEEVDGIRTWGDFYVADEQIIGMTYDESGRFLHAEVETDTMWANGHVGMAEIAWAAYSSPFTEWWADSPELHRNVAV